MIIGAAQLTPVSNFLQSGTHSQRNAIFKHTPVLHPARNYRDSTAYFAICRVVVSQRRNHSASLLRLAGWQNIQHCHCGFWPDGALVCSAAFHYPCGLTGFSTMVLHLITGGAPDIIKNFKIHVQRYKMRLLWLLQYSILLKIYYNISVDSSAYNNYTYCTELKTYYKQSG